MAVSTNGTLDMAVSTNILTCCRPLQSIPTRAWSAGRLERMRGTIVPWDDRRSLWLVFIHYDSTKDILHEATRGHSPGVLHDSPNENASSQLPTRLSLLLALGLSTANSSSDAFS